MAVGVADARDFAEMALRDLLAQEQVKRVAALKIAGLKQYARFADRIGHPVGIFGVQAERFLRKQVLVRRRGAQHQRLVAVRLGTDDCARYAWVTPDLAHVAYHTRAQRLGLPRGSRRIMVPDILYADTFPCLEPFHKLRRMNMGRTHQSNLTHISPATRQLLTSVMPDFAADLLAAVDSLQNTCDLQRRLCRYG